jgi:RNA polymerase sigma-70 factor (ECF subfamily)
VSTVPERDLDRQRHVVDAFLAAARGGDIDALLAVLDPDVVLRADATASRGGATEIRGATEVAQRAARGGARAARPALVDGSVGVIVAPLGRLMMVLRFTITDGNKVTEVEAIGDPDRLAVLDLAILD